MTTTTITYSDGTTQVETSASPQNSQASHSKTYTAQGTISTGAGGSMSGTQASS
ncbi:hypothetical protein [Bradyrhizobium macuxiense]|nr:hypothetical protein [Bradyrhizobium macuxiense]